MFALGSSAGFMPFKLIHRMENACKRCLASAFQQRYRGFTALFSGEVGEVMRGSCTTTRDNYQVSHADLEINDILFTWPPCFVLDAI